MKRLRKHPFVAIPITIISVLILILLLQLPVGARPVASEDPADNPKTGYENAAPCSGVNIEVLDVIGSGGSTHSIAIKGKTAYAGEEGTLVILDISQPVAPQRIGRLFLNKGNINKIVPVGWTHILVMTREGLAIIDVSQPGNLSLVSMVEIGARDVAVNGYLAYVAVEEGLQIIDFRQPSVPRWVGSYSAPSQAFDIAVDQDIAYLTTSDAGLRILDVSDPAQPEEIAAFEALFPVSSPDRSAIAIEWEQGIIVRDTIMQIIDLSDLTRPSQLGYYISPDERIYTVIVPDPYPHHSKRHAYLGTDGGLRIVDFGDPDDPEEVSFLKTDNPIYDLAFMDWFRVYLAESSGVRIVNVHSPTTPLTIGLHRGLKPGPIAMVGAYAYVADGTEGIQIVDASDPANLTIMPEQDLPGDVSTMTTAGELVLVGTNNGQMYILDAIDPLAASVVGLYETADKIENIAVEENTAYIAAGNWLRIVDISDPGEPKEISDWEALYNGPFFVSDVAVRDSLAYVATETGLFVLDVADPQEIEQVSLYEIDYNYVIGGPTITLSGFRAIYCYAHFYFASPTCLVFDISDPESLKWEYYLHPRSSDRAPSLELFGDYLYSTGGQVFDAVQPAWEIAEMRFAVDYTTRGMAPIGKTGENTNLLIGSWKGLFSLRHVVSPEDVQVSEPLVLSPIPEHPGGFWAGDRLKGQFSLRNNGSHPIELSGYGVRMEGADDADCQGFLDVDNSVDLEPDQDTNLSHRSQYRVEFSNNLYFSPVWHFSGESFWRMDPDVEPLRISAVWPPGHPIRGKVQDLSSQPVLGVTITLNDGQTRRTNANGTYEFRGLPKDQTYAVTPSLEGYHFRPPMQIVELDYYAAGWDIDFVALKGYTVYLPSVQ